MEWSGRAPALPANKAGEARRRRGARHVSGAVIDIDIGKLTPESLEEIVEQLRDFSVDVDNEKAKVKVFCE